MDQKWIYSGKELFQHRHEPSQLATELLDAWKEVSHQLAYRRNMAIVEFLELCDVEPTIEAAREWHHQNPLVTFMIRDWGNGEETYSFGCILPGKVPR